MAEFDPSRLAKAKSSLSFDPNRLSMAKESFRDAPNSPEEQDSPDTTMQALAKMAKAIYGATPAGAITNLPSLARGALGREQPEGLSPTQAAAGAAGSAARVAAPAAMRFAGENLDVMGGAGAGAMASLPFAPAAGPLAPLVPVAGALTGAMAARTAVRPMQAALGRPGAPYATAEELTQAGKEGAMQEAGGQILTGGIKMGAEGLNAIKASAIQKAKEILPDAGETLLRIPSESINRVLDRFKEFKPALKAAFRGPRREAQASTQNAATKAFENVNDNLLRARKIAGKRLEIAENQFIKRADDVPVADASDINAALNAWKAENPALADSADFKKIADAVKRNTPSGSATMGVSAGQPMSAKEAIALRRELDGLSSWSAGGVRPVENDAADRLAKDIAGYIRQNIRTEAERISPRYAQRLAEFSDMADAHNNALGTLRTVSGTDKDIAKKIENLATAFNSGPGPQDSILNIGADVKGGEKIRTAVQELADALAVRSFQKVPKVVPSGVILRIINTIAPTRGVVGSAGSALSGPAGRIAGATGTRGELAARLAAAIAAQQTR